MSKVKIQGHASGTGVLTVTAPNTSTDRTITLPDGTGTLLTTDGDGSSLTGITTDTTTIENNIALLGFYRASDNSKAKYNLVDQVIDEYTDATGVDAGNSTNELLTTGYYVGSTTVSPSVSGNWDSTGTDGDYTWYKWTTVTSSGTFTTDTAFDVEYLVIGGGGAGGGCGTGGNGGGGGAGGFRTATGLSVAATTISGITVGAGGTGGDYGVTPDSGDDSVFSSITSVGGGAAGDYNNSAADGGSGGGGTSGVGGADRFGGSGTAGQGYDGGNAQASNVSYGGGGGGGSLEGGNNASGGTAGGGGNGTASSITGSSVTYAGGGGGGTDSNGTIGTGGSGGGGNGCNSSGCTGGSGTANTGSGGGGAGQGTSYGGSGGSGIVIIKRPTTVTSVDDLTLISNATTAEAAPTTGDIVMLIEDASGTATINTDIKAYISRDGSAFSSQVTLTDEGDWGTNKRILAAHDVDISGITSGTSMKYKITTHNQSAGSKETKIHATSLAWA